jgi:hypothetical protein
MYKSFFGPIALLIIFTLTGCNEKDELRPPVIHFKTSGAYTTTGDTIAIGHRMIFGIQARSDESVLTNFTVKKKLADGTQITMMDTALYSDYLDIDKSFFQNVEPEATWLFTVMDRNRMTAQISLVIYKDPDSQFGGIHHIQGIKLGYQNNSEFGSFLIPATGEVLKTDSATYSRRALIYSAILRMMMSHRDRYSLLQAKWTISVPRHRIFILPS